MFKNHVVRDLSLLSLVKIALIAVIYYILFAPYDGKQVDAAAHMLGPASTQIQTHHQG
jgi:hypothetical protein